MVGVKEPLQGVVYPPLERLERYVAAGELSELTLAEAFIDSFRKHAGRVALRAPEGNVTYAELDSITDRAAAGFLRLGLKPLDRVLFQAGNSRDVIYAFLACLKAGLIPICTLSAHREHEIGYLGCHADARAHIVQGDDPKFDLVDFAVKMKSRIPTIRQVISIRGAAHPDAVRMEDIVERQHPAEARETVRKVPRDPYQVGLFQLSGGTTGIPKMIPRTNNDYLLNVTRTIELLGYRETDVMFMPLPFIHNAAMVCFWMPTLLSGAAFAIAEDLSPEAFGRVFQAHKPTFIGLIRALLPRFETMLDRGLGSIESVRACWCPDAARVIRQKFGIPAHSMFGMSEGLNMYTRLDDPPEILDWAVGRPLSPFDEVRLVEPGTDDEVALGEVGEFTCRGPYTLCGYYNAPERNTVAFSADGYYRSGDLMIAREIDGNRYYAFAGRTKDVIDRGSEKISCEEVEHAVATHPSIADAAVVAMPDPVLGERACAYIVLKHGAKPVTLPEISRYLQEFGMAKFKWPERLEVVDALPVTKVGKLDKAAMRRDIAAKLAQQTTGQGA